ncbi:hypothetical protein [Pelatocladus sp. BLCC-F211]|uniref:hypothetical protein n=1 Tax=Pelatocladus sp. BLCC-F211 TaxID=3342752 RepID=UPI0035BBAB06
MSRLDEGCDTLKNNGENNTIILRSGSNPEYGNINCLIESQSAKKLSFSVADNRKNRVSISGAVSPMDYIEKVLEKVKELARKLIEALLGPEAEPEPELIPIPVDDRSRRR